MTLKFFPRSSDLKSENGYGLAGYEFLFVPHTNYVSISHRLVTVHKRDTRRTTTDDDDAQTNFLWHRANFISFVRPKTDMDSQGMSSYLSPYKLCVYLSPFGHCAEA